MDVAEVTEGATSLLAGPGGASAGPAEAGQGFYNPAMALTRDVTVLAARAYQPPGRPEMLDGLAAAGARGLRVVNETDDWSATLNDRARRTARLAERNVRRLGLSERAVVRRRDLNALMAEGTWGFVEVDPYGSPVDFLAGAVRAVEDGGLLALTATDASALHGVEERPARRRYLGRPPPRRAPGWKAAAARFLAAAIVREAARFDRAARPVLVHHHQHAFRAYVRVEDGARAADRALADLERRVLCPDCYTWGPGSCECGAGEPTGPYHTGPLHDPDLLEAMDEARGEGPLARPDETSQLLERLRAEAELGPFYVDVDRAVEALGVGGPPPRARLRERLVERGIETARTHYGPNRLAYEGDPREVLAVVEELADG